MRAALKAGPALLFALLGLAAAALLARDIAAIGLHVPLDPNEGWNAYHALGARAGQLYPGGWMVNNYPPLSFELIARLGGDAVIAGRVVALLAFLASAAGIWAVLRRMGCQHFPAAFGALVFAGGLLIGSNYVAMDDPQLLGHALQMAALWLVLRRQATGGALLFAVSLFVKHNLIALPLAMLIWLMLEDRRTALRFAVSGIAAALIGMALFRLAYGLELWQVIAAPRGNNLANLKDVAGRMLPWSAAGFVVLPWLPRGRSSQLIKIYAVTALVIGFVFAFGDGVDVNIFFDAVIALSLGAGLAQDRLMPDARAAAALAVAVPLLLYGAQHFADDNSAYTNAFRIQASGDSAFLSRHSGPAMCEMLSLCYWAGKDAAVDVFNSGEAIKTGARDPAPMIRLLERKHFATLQFDALEPFALGPAVKTAMLARYRIDHSDDNGVFLLPK